MENSNIVWVAMKKRVTVDNCSVATVAHSTAAPSSQLGPGGASSTAGTGRKLPPLTREQRVSQLTLRRLQKLHDHASLNDADAPDGVSRTPNTSTADSDHINAGNVSNGKLSGSKRAEPRDALAVVVAAYNKQVAADIDARRGKRNSSSRASSSIMPTTSPQREELKEGEADEDTQHLTEKESVNDHSSAGVSQQLPGMALSLADVSMTAQDLIPVVDFLANSSKKIRSLSLLSLETPLGLAKQTTNLLVKLLTRQSSIIELQISDTCQLGQVHVLQLQQALDQNIQAAVRAEQKRQDLRDSRAQEREEQRQQDVMDFYYWENSNRMGIMQLQNSQRTDLIKQFHQRMKTILSGAQKMFTSALQEQERQRALRECQDAKIRLASHWVNDVWYSLCANAKIAEEGVFRESIQASLASALDDMHIQKRDHFRQSKMAERNRTDSQLAERAKLMIDERRERNILSGKHLGHYVASKMLAIHLRLLPSRLKLKEAKNPQSFVKPTQPTVAAAALPHFQPGTFVANGEFDSSTVFASTVTSATAACDEPPSPSAAVAAHPKSSKRNDGDICDDDEIDAALGERLRHSLADMKMRGGGTIDLAHGSSSADDAASKLAGIVRAKSLSSQRLSLFPDLANDPGSPKREDADGFSNENSAAPPVVEAAQEVVANDEPPSSIAVAEPSVHAPEEQQQPQVDVVASSEQPSLAPEGGGEMAAAQADAPKPLAQDSGDL